MLSTLKKALIIKSDFLILDPSSDPNPIKPHHRTSAAWVEKKSKSTHDLNAHFDEKIFRESYPNRGRGNGRAIDLPQSNFYKITPTLQVCGILISPIVEFSAENTTKNL